MAEAGLPASVSSVSATTTPPVAANSAAAAPDKPGMGLILVSALGAAAVVAVVAVTAAVLLLARRRRVRKVAAAELGLAGEGDPLPHPRAASSAAGAEEEWCGPLQECCGAVVEQVDEGLPEVEEELRAACIAGTTAAIAPLQPPLPGAAEEDDTPAEVLALLDRVRAAEAALDQGWAAVASVGGRRARAAGTAAAR
jgi:hypothetical protein